MRNPALSAFLEQLGNERVFAQIVIRRNAGFELRHVVDADRAPENLRTLTIEDLRELAQFTSRGAFRPLKAAPNLPSGWRLSVNEVSELERALETLYPGAVVDWFAARAPSPPVTDYREFVRRQSGMYRVTALLTSPQAATVTRACCDPRFCLKRRYWTVEGEAPEADGKSEIPCLEPCAIWLEFARKAVRIEQEAKSRAELSADEIASICEALERVLSSPDSDQREADFNAPTNPRRLRLVMEKLAALSKPLRVQSEEPD